MTLKVTRKRIHTPNAVKGPRKRFPAAPEDVLDPLMRLVRVPLGPVKGTSSSTALKPRIRKGAPRVDKPKRLTREQRDAIRRAPKIEREEAPERRVEVRPGGLLGKIFDIRKYMNSFVLEREEETHVMLLSVLSGGSFFFYGSYGTSKTRQIREMAHLFGMRVFCRLLSESTKPQHIFGPPDVPGLAKGHQRHKIKGYAPDAHWIFFDEVFRASGIVLIPLRELINEHIFENLDDGTIQCPTMVVSSASNNIPTEEELLADYDRYLMRCHIEYLKSPASIDRMIDLRLNPSALKRPAALTLQETNRCREAARRVAIPPEIRKLAIRVRDQVTRATSMIISDRRFGDAMTVIQANALLNGRKVAIEDDVGVLMHMFWDKPENISKVRAIVSAASSQHGADLVTYEELASDVWETAMETGDMETAQKKLKEFLASAQRFTSSTGQTVVRSIRGYLHRVNQILRDRKEFVLIEMHSKVQREYIYKLSPTSATSWSGPQLRSCGFHWFKKHGYWYHHGPQTDGKLPAHRNQITRDVVRTLNVVPRIKKM